ncbi:MAG: cytochrome c oxidase subunit I [Dehalococcoidia bacterium]|nr:cytochrome c oxidase subunit I [Dehalococcoidia bacterium]
MAMITDVLRRPTGYSGVWGWVTTVDHKRIGVLYGVTAFIFFLVGGIEALLLRLQLAGPDGTVLTAAAYNQIMTMHGTTMIFLVVMPLSAAFFNVVIPLMIGARDVAFPRLNAFSYWVFLTGALLLHMSFLVGGPPDAGWFGYANLTEKPFSESGIDFWVLGLQVLGISSMAAAFNFLVTIINMRAPGMSLMRMPLFVWMTMITSFLLVTAFPVLTVGMMLLLFDRLFGTHFYAPAGGGDPVLWQQYFWLFGHPEVYILILPAMGIVSEVLPTFSRKPLFGYRVVVYSGIVIGFLGWMVWSHHMFTVGLGAVVNAVFASTTFLIAVPTGVKIFNWIATLWGGAIQLKAPLYFALGFIAMFIIGGLSGVMHASVPVDTQHQDTYFVVAHFHYVLFGGSIFGLFAGIYYWFPKVTGRLLHDGIGKLHFWLMLLGFNLTFGPMHFLGVAGMPRRIYTYPEEMGWAFWNLVETFGAFMIAASMLVFLFNFFRSLRQGEEAGNDPWDARTLEWSIPSPPPIYNFATIPTVHSRDPWWEEKEKRRGAPVPVAGGSNGEPHQDEGHGIHMPSPSYWPIVVALGLGVMAGGLLVFASVNLISGLIVTLGGGLVAIIGIFGWSLEPASAGPEHG